MELHRGPSGPEDGDRNDVDEVGVNLIVQLRAQRIKPQAQGFARLPIRVRIYKVASPTRFFFHLAGNYHELRGVERELADFYDENPDFKFPKEKEDPPVKFEFYGLYSKTKKRWVRVLRDDFQYSKRGFTVVLVDYAEREYVADEKMLRELPQQFCELPAQGYKCQLYMEDVIVKKVWSELETTSFREKVLHRTVGITPVDCFGDHPYIREFCVFVHVDEPGQATMIFGGVYPYGTEDVRPKVADVEMYREANRRWASR